MDCISITKGPELLPFQRGMFKCVVHVFLQYLNDIFFLFFFVFSPSFPRSVMEILN